MSALLYGQFLGVFPNLLVFCSCFLTEERGVLASENLLDSSLDDLHKLRHVTLEQCKETMFTAKSKNVTLGTIVRALYSLLNNLLEYLLKPHHRT
jgi:hypothetical protein